jgi:hypothetical protein
MLIAYGVELGVYRIGIVRESIEEQSHLMGWWDDCINPVKLEMRGDGVYGVVLQFLPFMDALPADSWTVKSFEIKVFESQWQGKSFQRMELQILVKDRNKKLSGVVVWEISKNWTYILVRNFGRDITTDGESEDMGRILI